MTAVVVDASVGIKWFLREAYEDAALRLLDGRFGLLAPDLFGPEFANILWKKVGRAEITGEEARQIIIKLDGAPILIQPSRPLLPFAIDIACKHGRTAYDSLYIALAVYHQIRLVTADERLYNAVSAGPLAAHLLWVEDIPL